MDFSGLEKVVDRLAAAGPSNVSPARCWYCQRIQPWFLCDCPDVREIRVGRKAAPRVVFRGGHAIVILDEETIRKNEALGRKRYVPVDNVDIAPVAAVDIRVVDNVDTATVDTSRKAYQAEWLRKKRAEAKGV
jgi:hypothetical protein